MNIDDRTKQIIRDLLIQIDNPDVIAVEIACEYLGHPVDPRDEHHRCFCRAIIPGDTVKIVASIDLKGAASSASFTGIGFTNQDTRGKLLSKVMFDEPIEVKDGELIEIVINPPEEDDAE